MKSYICQCTPKHYILGDRQRVVFHFRETGKILMTHPALCNILFKQMLYNKNVPLPVMYLKAIGYLINKERILIDSKDNLLKVT